MRYVLQWQNRGGLTHPTLLHYSASFSRRGAAAGPLPAEGAEDSVPLRPCGRNLVHDSKIWFIGGSTDICGDPNPVLPGSGGARFLQITPSSVNAALHRFEAILRNQPLLADQLLMLLC